MKTVVVLRINWAVFSAVAEPTVVSSSLGLESSVGYSYLFLSSKRLFADTSSIIPLE